MKKAMFGLILGMIVFAFGCSNVVTDKESEGSILVKRDKAEELDVELNIGVGELTVAKGTENWVEGSLESNLKDFEPIVSYDYRNKKGEIVIEQKNQGGWSGSDIKNKWNLELTEDVPMNLSIKTGAAMANLDLQGLQLEKLDFEAGVGDFTVDLSGDWVKSFKTKIKAGVGAATIIVPSKAGVKITSEKGIGKVNVIDFISKGDGIYVNEAYEDADVILEVHVEMGVGEITFKMD